MGVIYSLLLLDAWGESLTDIPVVALSGVGALPIMIDTIFTTQMMKTQFTLESTWNNLGQNAEAQKLTYESYSIPITLALHCSIEFP